MTDNTTDPREPEANTNDLDPVREFVKNHFADFTRRNAKPPRPRMRNEKPTH